MKIAVGLSGGIDSTVAAKCLIEQGHKVCGVTLRLLSGERDGSAEQVSIIEAAAIASSLGIPHCIYDFRTEFQKEIVGYFIESFRQGETPNPCYLCNKRIKFGLFLNRALQEGFEAIATGHYAKIFSDSSGRFILAQGADKQKDQSYFLALLDQRQLGHTIFPLAGMFKSEVRHIAMKAGLINAHKADSQDICFVPDGNYAAVIEAAAPNTFLSGNFVDINSKKIGTHHGLHKYTIGQRRGLGLPFGYPVYVVEKSAKDNSITVGTEADLAVTACTVREVNWIAKQPPNPFQAEVKTRYRQQPQQAIIEPISTTEARIIFAKPERAVARGQAAVFYCGELIAGGGIISDIERH